MKKIYSILSVCVAAVLFASCDMNLTPKTSISYDPDGQLIQTSANLTAFETGILARFRSMVSGDYEQVEEVMMDGFNATISFGNRYGDVHRSNNTFNSSNSYIEGIWAGYYTALKDYNILIAALDNVPEELKEAAAVVQGEAYFFRAYTYLQLARHWGKAYSSTASTDLCVPLVLKYDQLEKPERATVEAVYAAIGEDLEKAEELLADVPGALRSPKPTIDAVYALQARYYLDIKDYDKALERAQKVIESSAGYAISSTAEEMTAEFTDDKGKEAIFQVYVNISGEMPNSKRFFTYNNQNAEKVEVYGPDYLPSKVLLDSYSEGDLRKAAWFTDSKHPVEFNSVPYTGLFSVFIKFEGNPTLTTSLLNGSNAPKPLKIGEMYLIAAEAALQGSAGAGTAAQYLNELQSKRKALRSDATMENIKKEWFRETVGEGLRLSCLKRWGDGFGARAAQEGALRSNIVMTGEYYEQRSMTATDRAFVWPIPNYEMKVNTNLKQNDGYAVTE